MANPALSLGVISGQIVLDLTQFDLATTSILDGMVSITDAFSTLTSSAEAMSASVGAAFSDITASIDAQIASVDSLGESYDRLAASMNAAQSGNVRAVPASYANAAPAASAVDTGAISGLDAAGAGADATLSGMDASAAGLDASLAGVDASAAGVDASLTGMAGAGAEAAGGMDAAAVSADGLGASEDAAAVSTEGLSKGLNMLKMPLLIAGVAVVALGAVAVHMAGDFQASMTQLVTGAGESQSNLAMVTNGILAMAPAVGESTTQLAAGMFMIESSGYHGAAGLNILKAAAEGAKVGNADLGVVSDATTTLLTDFGKQAGGASGAVNLLIATVASGKVHLQDLASSLSQVAPTAAAAHVKITDMMAALATMTGEGVPAAQAATYLRQTIIGLDAPSSAAAKAMAAVGLSSSAVATEMQQSLPGALQMITDAVGKKFPVGSAAYVEALKNISGGSKTMQGMLDLTGNHLATFQGNVTGVAGAVHRGGASINGWAATQGDFNTKMDQLGATIQVAAIKIGDKLLPVMGQLATILAARLPGAIAGVSHFFQLLTQHGTAMAPVIGIVAGMIGGALVAALVAAAIAAWTALVPLLIFAAPFILIGAAIGLVIAGIVLLISHWAQISAFFENVGSKVSAFFQNLWKVVTTWIGNVLGAIGGWFASVGGWFRDRFNAILAFVGGIFLKIYDAIKGPLDAVLAVVVPIFDFIADVIRVVSDIITKLIEIAWDWIWGKIVAVVSAIRDWLVGEWTIIHNDLDVALAVLTALWDAAWRYVSTLVMNAVSPILTWLRDQWHTLSTDVQTLWNVVWGYVSDAWTRILTLIEDKATALKNAILLPFQEARDEIQAIVKDLGNFAITELNKAILGWQTMGNDLGSAINTVAKAVGVSDRVPALTLPQIPLLASGTQNFAGGLAIVGEEGPEMVHLPPGASVLPAVPTDQLLRFGLGFLRGVGGGEGGIPGFAGGVGSFFGGVGTAVGGAVSGAKNLASTVGSDISDAIGDLSAMIKEGPGGILSKALAASGFTSGALPGAFSGLAAGALTTLEGWAKTYLSGLLAGASSSGLTYSGTGGGFANAANMSEFQGYFGDCGETAELLALHVLKGAALTGTDLDNIVHRDQAKGWAASNGVVSVGAIQQDLTQFEQIKSQTYGGGAWLSVLNQYAGKKPIIFLYSNAGGGLPGDERGVQWHFNTNLGALGGGKWLFGDGDNSLAASGKLNIYTSANLAAANPNAEIVVGMAGGGILNEPVMGMGLVSGGRYLLGEAGPEAVVPLGRRGPTGRASGMGGGDMYNITVQVVAAPDDGEPYQAGQAFGNGFAQGFQQARTQRGL